MLDRFPEDAVGGWHWIVQVQSATDPGADQHVHRVSPDLVAFDRLNQPISLASTFLAIARNQLSAKRAEPEKAQDPTPVASGKQAGGGITVLVRVSSHSFHYRSGIR